MIARRGVPERSLRCQVLALYRLCMMLAASFKCFSKSERRCTQMSTVLLILLFSRLLSGIIFPDWYMPAHFSTQP